MCSGRAFGATPLAHVGYATMVVVAAPAGCPITRTSGFAICKHSAAQRAAVTHARRRDLCALCLGLPQFPRVKDFEAVLNELSEEEKAPGAMTCSRSICGAADALMCNP